MAKNGKKNDAPAGEAVQTATEQAQATQNVNINLDLLRALVTATSPVPVSPEFLQPLIDNGYAKVDADSDVDASGNLPGVVTDEGKAYLASVDTSQAVNPSPIAVNPAGETATMEQIANGTVSEKPAETPKPKEKPVFSAPIQFELPEAGKRGGARPEQYPFSSLEVGGAFFIPATAAKPDPATEFASTVASATKRFAEVVEGEMVKNKRGNMVPKLNFTREFKIRRIDDGKAFGPEFAGKKGAVVGRVK